MSDNLLCPLPHQGVRLVVPGESEDVTAIVESYVKGGEMVLTLGVLPPKALTSGDEVEVHYFRQGTLFIAHATVVDLQDGQYSGWNLTLTEPIGTRSLRSRRFSRLNVRIPVRFAKGSALKSTPWRAQGPRTWPRLIEDETLTGELETLSAGGLCLRSHTSLELSDMVVVSLELASSALTLLGQVVSLPDNEASRAGVAFVDLDETAKQALTHYIAETSAARLKLSNAAAM